MTLELDHIFSVRRVEMVDDGSILFKIWLDDDPGGFRIDPNLIINSYEASRLGLDLRVIHRGTKLRLKFKAFIPPVAEDAGDSPSTSRFDLNIRRIVSIDEMQLPLRTNNAAARWLQDNYRYIELDNLTADRLIKKSSIIRLIVHLSNEKYSECRKLSADTMFSIEPM